MAEQPKLGRSSIIVIIWSSWCFPCFAFLILVENHGLELDELLLLLPLGKDGVKVLIA